MSTPPKSPAEALAELTTAVNAVIAKVDAEALRTGRIERKIEELPTSPQHSENSEALAALAALREQIAQDTKGQNSALAEVVRSVAQIQADLSKRPAPSSPARAELSPTMLAELRSSVARIEAAAGATAGRRGGTGGTSGGNADRVAAAIAERLAPAPVRPRTLAAVAAALFVVVMLAAVGLGHARTLAGQWAWSSPGWWVAALLTACGYALVAVGFYVAAVAIARYLVRWWGTRPTDRLLAALARRRR